MRPKPLTLTLPYPPSANRYWRVYRGRAVKSAEARAYWDEIGYRYLKLDMLDGELAVTLDFYRPRKSGDLDNRIKICLDALQGIAFRDDKQVGEIHARRFEDKKNPRVEVTITRR